MISAPGASDSVPGGDLVARGVHVTVGERRTRQQAIDPIPCTDRAHGRSIKRVLTYRVNLCTNLCV